MSINRIELLDAVSANGDGSVVVPKGKDRVFQVVITGTATCTLQASIDGSNWENLRSSTANEMYSTAEPWPFLRGSVSGYSSGTVTLVMAHG